MTYSRIDTFLASGVPNDNMSAAATPLTECFGSRRSLVRIQSARPKTNQSYPFVIGKGRNRRSYTGANENYAVLTCFTHCFDTDLASAPGRSRPAKLRLIDSLIGRLAAQGRRACA